MVNLEITPKYVSTKTSITLLWFTLKHIMCRCCALGLKLYDYIGNIYSKFVNLCWAEIQSFIYVMFHLHLL